jgi:hypothetical protein
MEGQAEGAGRRAVGPVEARRLDIERDEGRHILDALDWERLLERKKRYPRKTLIRPILPARPGRDPRPADRMVRARQPAQLAA